MDIKFSNANLTKYWDAVKDCDEKGSQRLNLRQEGEWVVVESVPLKDHQVEQSQAPAREGMNRQLRTELYQGLQDELSGLNVGDSGQTVVRSYLEDVRTKLMGSAGPDEGGTESVTDLDSREVRQILSEAGEKKSRVIVENLGWDVADLDDGQELEWQRVTRGRHATVKANDRQVNTLVYGKSAALSRALGVTMAEADALDLRNFTQAEDGTISFDATRQVEGRTVTERLQLGVDGLLTSRSRDAAYKPLADVLSGNEWSISCYEMKSPERAFHVANVAEIVKFLNFYGSVELPERNYMGRITKTALFNLMQDADKEIQRLRESGKLKGNAVTNETWWKCLGLKGKFPKGAKGATLATAFQEAVVAKTIDDFLEAKGWDKLADEKTGLTIRQWYYGAFGLQTPRNWGGRFLSQKLLGFASAIGLSYSQKLKALRSEDGSDVEVRPVFRQAAGGMLKGEVTASIDSTRQSGLTVRYAPQVQEGLTTWTTHRVVDRKGESEATVTGLRNQGLTDKQIKRILDIPEERRAWLGGFGLSAIPSKTTVDVSLFGPQECFFWSVDAARFAETFDLINHDGVHCYCPQGEWLGDWIRSQVGYDFIRSFADKPMINTENHIIQDHCAGYGIPKEHVYSALWQDAIHGQRATAHWTWERGGKASYSKAFYGLAPERPEILEMLGRCSLDLQRFSDELVPIQEESPTVVIMWSLSSKVLGKSHGYPYAPASFLGEPVGFVNEEALAHYLKDGVKCRSLLSARVIVLSGVTHLPDESVAALKKLEREGVAILAVGDTLAFDDIGRSRSEMPWPSRAEAKNHAIFDLLAAECGKWNLPRRPRLVQPVYGIETHGYEKDGVCRLSICNQVRGPVEIELPSEGVDLISGKKVTKRFKLAPLMPMFVEYRK